MVASVRTSKRRWWIIGGLTMLMLLAISGCALSYMALRSFAEIGFLGSTVADLPPDRVERAAAITLPPSAANLRSHYESFQDYIIHVRFDMDPADLDQLLASTHLELPLSSTAIPMGFSAPENLDWWTPEQAQRFQVGDTQVQTSHGYPEYQWILIDMTNAQRYTVYVVAFDT
jgi:hypothetical protein